MVPCALVGLMGQGEAASVLLMGRGVQGRFGVRRVRQGSLAVACAHSMGGQIPLVVGQGRRRAAFLIKHRCGVGAEAGTGVVVCKGGEVRVGVGVCIVVWLIAGVRT